MPILYGGEQKSKPAQHGVKELRCTGLSPDFIICRCAAPITKEIRDKVALFANIPSEFVFDAPDMEHIFQVPMHLNKQGIAEKVAKRLQLEPRKSDLARWEKLTVQAIRIDHMPKESALPIAFVGKYTGFQDSYLSVMKSLDFASYYANVKLEIQWIDASEYEKATTEEQRQAFLAKFAGVRGILVPGGFGERGVEGKIMAAQVARTKKIPYLGLCLGMQVALIEFCRSVLGWKDAHSTEFNPYTTKPVIKFMPEIDPLIKGASMRLGAKETLIQSEDTLAYRIYGSKTIRERHRHRYEFNTEYKAEVEKAGMVFSGCDTKKERMEIIEMPDHPFFLGTQFHPEFLGSTFIPSRIFLAFLYAISGQLEARLKEGSGKMVISEKKYD